MPQRDIIHHIVKEALHKDGWQITEDPYVITYGERFLFVDIGAETIIGAQLGEQKIAIEIKEFRRKSLIADLEQAIGQYILYQLLLNRVEPMRILYLAITDRVYQQLSSEPIGELVIEDLPLKLLVLNMEKKEVQQWIPA